MILESESNTQPFQPTSTSSTSLETLCQSSDFPRRHIGPSLDEQKSLLQALNLKSRQELIDSAVPANILSKSPFDISQGKSESELLGRARELADKNKITKTYIGMGYYNTHTPSVILRNITENPGWYTAYTPYQAEISQGRMEALLNFQTMVCDLTGMPIANSSLLDEGTAAAEAMAMALALKGRKGARKFFVDKHCLPQTIDVLKTRAEPLGVEILVGQFQSHDFSEAHLGGLVQYPNVEGEVKDYKEWVEKVQNSGGLAVVAADPLSLCLLEAPGDWGTDIVVGSTQRFGVPLGFGGPHAAYLATKEDYKRSVPGRFIGVSKDSQGQHALRLALQTREQHIRREKATSNICTSQVLLAVMASMYAVYHGPKGLHKIASRVHRLASLLALGLQKLGHQVLTKNIFDTVTFKPKNLSNDTLVKRCQEQAINLNRYLKPNISVSLDETTTLEDVHTLLKVLTGESGPALDFASLIKELDKDPTPFTHTKLLRKNGYLSHPVFNSYHSETEMMRYLNRLQSKDISLVHSMIPLGSCTMKLNAATEMMPVTWPGFASIHPFAPKEQTLGYRELIGELEGWLAELTGFDTVTVQPNAGSQGEYAGLLCIHHYHLSRGDKDRNVCLIPQSAHGTNPASAVMVGMKVIVIKCDEQGNIDVADLKSKAEQHKENLSALMVTYPSTHGVFEESISEICKIIHDNGGMVYMDGANMNALLGLCRPGEFGPDVAHLNLHKTFCIPHGGGGPGVGPIGVTKELAPHLPSHVIIPECGPSTGSGAVASAPWGSPGILPISWAYISMMGADGLKEATEVAILNANYVAHRLEAHYPILYRGKNGRVAHECIIDTRSFKTSGINVDDIAKRLMDYGFHAPTMSWPVAGTLMIEPTESESKAELDRFCDALISIRQEIQEVVDGKVSAEDSVLRNAPHSQLKISSSDWPHPYTREKAAFPLDYLKLYKPWPAVGRVDNAYGDKNFVCTCLPLEEYEGE